MPQNRVASSGANPVNMAALDDLLDDLDLEMSSEDEVFSTGETVVEEPEVELDHADLESLEIKLELSDNYAEQQSDTADPETEAAEIPGKRQKTRKASSPATPRVAKPRIDRDLTKLSPEFFCLEGDPNSVMADASMRDAVISTRPTQVKIADKFDNLFVSLAAGRKPSTYVVDALAFLEKSTSMSTSALVSHFAVNLDIGTARSQAGQIMKLFEVLKIGLPDGKNSIKINPKSTLVERLNKIVGGAAA